MQDMLNGYFAVFDQYDVSSEMQVELDQLRVEMTQLAEECNSDLSVFMPKFMEGELYERYQNLINQAFLANENTNTSQVTETESETADTNEEVSIMSVRDYVEQYRVSYDAVKESEYRKRGEKAYENIFAVADRTEDMQEAQLIIERERLLFKIVSEDALDIFETIYEAMDPLFDAMTSNVRLQTEMYKNIDSADDLNYESELISSRSEALAYESKIKITIASSLSLYVMEYLGAKESVRSWKNDNLAKSGVEFMMIKQRTIRELYSLMNDLGITWDSIEEDPFFQLWLLGPKNLDTLARVKRTLDPHNIQVVKEVLFNEILTDKTISEILLSEQENIMHYDVLKRENEVASKFSKKAEELNKDIPYFQYMERLSRSDKMMMESRSGVNGVKVGASSNPADSQGGLGNNLVSDALNNAGISNLGEGLSSLGNSVKSSSTKKKGGLFGKLFK